MTGFEDMTAPEIRAELDNCRRRVADLARKYRNAHKSSDLAWEAGIGSALDQELAQERRLARLLHLGIAA